MNAIQTALPACSEGITSELFEQWAAYIDGSERTRDTYTRNVKHFAEWLRVNQITAPTRADVIRYREELAQEHKPATVHGYIVAVKLFFQWLAAAGIYPNIAERVKNAKVDPYHKKDPLTSKQAGKVLDSLDLETLAGLRDYAIICVMLTTGLRTKSIELATLAIENGATLQEVQQLLGHKNISITMIYLHDLERAQNTSADRITAAIFSGGGEAPPRNQ